MAKRMMTKSGGLGKKVSKKSSNTNSTEEDGGSTSRLAFEQGPRVSSEPPPDYMIVYRVNATCRIEGGTEMFAEYDLEPGTDLSDADKEWLCEYMKQFPMITCLVIDPSRGSS